MGLVTSTADIYMQLEIFASWQKKFYVPLYWLLSASIPLDNEKPNVLNSVKVVTLFTTSLAVICAAEGERERARETARERERENYVQLHPELEYNILYLKRGLTCKSSYVTVTIVDVNSSTVAAIVSVGCSNNKIYIKQNMNYHCISWKSNYQQGSIYLARINLGGGGGGG